MTQKFWLTMVCVAIAMDSGDSMAIQRVSRHKPTVSRSQSQSQSGSRSQTPSPVVSSTLPTASSIPTPTRTSIPLQSQSSPSFQSSSGAPSPSSSRGPILSPTLTTPTASITPITPITPAVSPPPISSLLKPAQWKSLLEEKEIPVSASLQGLPNQAPLKKYSFYTAMLVGNTTVQTRKVLTNYQVYAEIIPYIDQVSYQTDTHVLEMSGGIWNYKLHSKIEFIEKTDRWIHYKVIAGHFVGLEGNIFFESQGEKGTAVYLSGEQKGSRWPPQFVIERGAEIVFGFTAKRMRSYIESLKKVEKGVPNENQRQDVPQPRSHL